MLQPPGRPQERLLWSSAIPNLDESLLAINPDYTHRPVGHRLGQTWRRSWCNRLFTTAMPSGDGSDYEVQPMLAFVTSVGVSFLTLADRMGQVHRRSGYLRDHFADMNGCPGFNLLRFPLGGLTWLAPCLMQFDDPIMGPVQVILVRNCDCVFPFDQPAITFLQ